jgi:RimJ/RimL family protein N-acetyltransferase
MGYYRKLSGVKCYLAPCQPEDAEKWAAWFNDLEVTLPLGDEAYAPCSLERMRDDVRSISAHQDHVFSIVDLESDCLIGRCMLFGLDQVNRSAMLGIVIGEKAYWSRGYGREAVELLLDYAFNLLNLNSVMLGVFSFNQRGIHSYEKAGFRVIGRRRQARLIGDQKFDAVLMDILAEEFRSRHESQVVRVLNQGNDQPRDTEAQRSK